MSEQFSGTKEVSEFLKFDLEKLNLYIKEIAKQYQELIVTVV